MTRTEFIQECTQRLILPALALEECHEITEALREHDDEKVRELLDTRF